MLTKKTIALITNKLILEKYLGFKPITKMAAKMITSGCNNKIIHRILNN
jgi:hypothetical protein